MLQMKIIWFTRIDDGKYLFTQAADVPPGVSLQRRNSAPEMSEPAQFVDHGSMELW